MSTKELFLIGKKVKLSKSVNITEVIRLLKEISVHTKYIENKEKLHSLFFLENETMFLLESPKAESEFNDNMLTEISETDFLEWLGYKQEELEDAIKEKPIKRKKKKKSKFLKIKQDNGKEFCFRKKHITMFYYNEIEQRINITLKNRDSFNFTCSNDSFDRIKQSLEN